MLDGDAMTISSEEEALSNRSTSSPPNLQAASNEHDESEISTSYFARSKKWVLWFLKDQWFLIALGSLIILASQVQVPTSYQEIKSTIVTYLCVAIIFFVTGCTLPTRVLIDNYTRWKLHLFVQIQCFLLTSATTFGIVSACATNRTFLDPWLLIGLIFLGCVPTTISSNVVMTRQASGNTALTVVESTIGNFLGPFLTPALVKLYTSTRAWYTDVLPDSASNFGEVYRRVFKQLGLSLFLPLFVGQVVQNVFPKATKKVFTDWKMSKLSSISLLLVVWQTFDQAFETGAFETMQGSNAIFIVFISIGLWMLWLSICLVFSSLWLSREDSISVAYCVPAKTPAMGVPLTVVMYVGIARIDQSRIQIPLVVFQGFQIMFGSLLTIVFRRWNVAGKRSKHSPQS